MMTNKKIYFTKSKISEIITTLIKPYYLTFCKNKRIYPTTDLEHDIYLAVLKDLHKYNHIRGSISTYVYMLTRKYFYRCLRKDHLIVIPEIIKDKHVCMSEDFDFTKLRIPDPENQEPLTNEQLTIKIKKYTKGIELTTNEINALINVARGESISDTNFKFSVKINRIIKRVRES